MKAPLKKHSPRDYNKLAKKMLETTKLIAEWKTTKLYIVSQNTADAPSRKKTFRLEVSNAEGKKKELDIDEETFFRLLIRGMS